MRRSLLVCGCGLGLLLFGIGLAFVGSQTRHGQVPPDATGVRIDRHGLSGVHVNYRIPTSWTLNDLYQFHAAQGWERDRSAERSLQRPWAEIPTTVFAIFTRERLFGLVSERAVVGMPPDARAGVQVRMVRCLKIKPWIECL
jgi:hypothetical protein